MTETANNMFFLKSNNVLPHQLDMEIVLVSFNAYTL